MDKTACARHSPEAYHLPGEIHAATKRLANSAIGRAVDTDSAGGEVEVVISGSKNILLPASTSFQTSKKADDPIPDMGQWFLFES